MWLLDADKDIVNLDHARQIVKQQTAGGYIVVAIYNSAEDTIIEKYETEEDAQEFIDGLLGELNNGENRTAES